MTMGNVDGWEDLYEERHRVELTPEQKQRALDARRRVAEKRTEQANQELEERQARWKAAQEDFYRDHPEAARSSGHLHPAAASERRSHKSELGRETTPELDGDWGGTFDVPDWFDIYDRIDSADDPFEG